MTGEWHRLDPKSIAVSGMLVATPMVPAISVMLISEAGPAAILRTGGIWFGLAVVFSVLHAISWYFTRYRITPDRFELRHGNLARSHRSIPRDRIRSVEATAEPAHRLFGLSVVKIGTGQQPGGSSELKLDAVSKARAEELRAILLQKESTSDSQIPVTETEIARLNPTWLRYSALTVPLVLVVWGAIGSGIGTFREVLKSAGIDGLVAERVETVPITLGITVLALALLVVGVLGAIVLSAEMWWNLRLTREPDGTLRVRRGLITTRSMSLEERRLRGVEISEPLLLRWAGGARINAVATGLSEVSKEDKQSDRQALLPPAPRAEAQRVAAAVLQEPRSPTDGVQLRAHPRAALRRRLWRALVATLLAVAAAAATLAAFGAPLWPAWAAAAALGPAACGFGVDAYRGLGHALHGQYLVARRGSAVRKTVALQRSGIIGWRIEQSLLQRRIGLATVLATTAAGSGAYGAQDVRTSDGLEFADEAVPGLLTPFLEYS